MYFNLFLSTAVNKSNYRPLHAGLLHRKYSDMWQQEKSTGIKTHMYDHVVAGIAWANDNITKDLKH